MFSEMKDDEFTPEYWELLIDKTLLAVERRPKDPDSIYSKIPVSITAVKFSKNKNFIWVANELCERGVGAWYPLNYWQPVDEV